MKRWIAVAARIVLLAAGLVILASIGRVAATRAATVAASADAGAVELRTSLPTAETPVDAAPPLPTQAPALPASSARATPEDPVYVNYASKEQLMRLPGVGEKRAAAIVALRGRLGRFQRIEDLLRVKGIGRATIKKLRPLIRLELPEAGTL